MSSDILVLIKKIYSQHRAGGHLHVVLDDGNVEDNFLDFCEGEIETNDLTDIIDFDDYEEFKQTEYQCVNALRKLSVDERLHVLDLFWGSI